MALNIRGGALRQQSLQLGGIDQQVVHGGLQGSVVFSGGAGQCTVAQHGGGDAAGHDEGHAQPADKRDVVVKQDQAKQSTKEARNVGAPYGLARSFSSASRIRR